jgi:hypothetical protein
MPLEVQWREKNTWLNRCDSNNTLYEEYHQHNPITDQEAAADLAHNPPDGGYVYNLDNMWNSSTPLEPVKTQKKTVMK